VRGQRFFVPLLMAALLTVSACSTNAPAPTDTPAPEATDSPTPEPADTPTPTPVLTTSFTPWPTLAPTPEPTVPPTPAPKITPSVSPTPTSPAQFCTGSASNRTFFLQAAHDLKFTIYCATSLPAGWSLASGNYAGSTLTLTYKYRTSTSKFTVQEGGFCVGNAVNCEGGPHPVAGSGTASFDGLSGAFLTTATGLLIAINPGTKTAYFITSTNVAAATLAGFSANMKAVPQT